nr:MAG TPA: hypothetical protein [Caudoviricetes sp.]
MQNTTELRHYYSSRVHAHPLRFTTLLDKIVPKQFSS